MSIEVRLYGKLRKLVSNRDEHSGKIGLIEIDEKSFDKISDILGFLEIDDEEISHIFHNGEYSSKNTSVNKGDRLAIFPKEMSLLYTWYFPEKDRD